MLHYIIAVHHSYIVLIQCMVFWIIVLYDYFMISLWLYIKYISNQSKVVVIFQVEKAASPPEAQGWVGVVRHLSLFVMPLQDVRMLSILGFQINFMPLLRWLRISGIRGWFNHAFIFGSRWLALSFSHMRVWSIIHYMSVKLSYSYCGQEPEWLAKHLSRKLINSQVQIASSSDPWVFQHLIVLLILAVPGVVSHTSCTVTI